MGGTRFGIYFSDKFRVAEATYLTIGGRINTLSVNDTKMGFAPRFSLAYFISPRDILRFSGGFHQQNGDYFSLQSNDLRMKHAGHLSVTYDRTSDDLDLRVTLYNKQYGNLFLIEEDIITNNGKGFARGFEFFLKRKHPKYDAFFVYNFLSSKRKEHDVPVLTTSPFARTSSSSATWTLVVPYFTAWGPLELLAIIPPIVAASVVEGSIGK